MCFHPPPKAKKIDFISLEQVPSKSLQVLIFFQYKYNQSIQCNINETLVLTTAKQMKSLGLQAAGYNYVNIDDCYSLKTRNAAGDIVEDPVKFGSGMRNLTDQIHAMGL